MKKLTMLKIVNGLIGTLVSILAITAFSIKFLNVYSVFNISFTSLHSSLGIAFFVLILSHIFLNFNWIKANYLSKKK